MVVFAKGTFRLASANFRRVFSSFDLIESEIRHLLSFYIE
ncbi:hypothetical protein PAUR_a1517 [Pseudoalteromonas aurantia 208]|uniref:Uncharacterized protein n=1 Tax=Pseudoalteromonas aurantia 208 TaxID=1314867 RepID=A0ABR9ECE2_9GAMM|nr:hypothetical protein [Pseudoalteromonas aurantia 208]